MAPQKKSDGGTTEDDGHVLPFPGGIPRPHEARNWGRSLLSVLAKRGLTDIILDQVPEGKFDPLYPDEMLEKMPAPTASASWKDKLSYRQHCDDI